MRKSNSKVNFYLTVEEYDSELFITLKASKLSRKKKSQELPTETSIFLTYPSELIKSLEFWQSTYHAHYETRVNTPISENSQSKNTEVEKAQGISNFRIKKSGSGEISPNAKLRRIKRAEARLVQDFLDWTNSGDFLKLRKYIREVIGISVSDNQILDEEKLPEQVNIFLDCRGSHANKLRKLPWSCWQPLPETMLATEDKVEGVVFDFFHTTNAENDLVYRPQNIKVGNRFLVLVADDEFLDFKKQQNLFQTLEDRKLATIKYLEAKNYNRETFVKALKVELQSSKGWTGLIVIAHGNDIGDIGQLKFSSEISFSISVIEKELEIAKNNGLQFAFLSCCRGEAIANFLIKQGLHQVLFMTEKVSNGILENITKIFVEELVQYSSIEQIKRKIVYFYNDQEKKNGNNKEIFPSIYLIPQIFYGKNKQIEDFQFQLYSKYSQSLKVLPKLLPKTAKETLALSCILFFSAFLFPVKEVLTDSRLFVQALIRTPWVFHNSPQPTAPPIQIISIDQKSINEARQNNLHFNADPIDRRYLAQIVRKLDALDVKVVAINYLLSEDHIPELGHLFGNSKDNLESLGDSVRSYINNDASWLIFASDVHNNEIPLIQLANPQWSFWADHTYIPWQMDIPETLDCRDECPLAFRASQLYELFQWLNTEEKKEEMTLLNQSLKTVVNNGESSTDHSIAKNNLFKNLIQEQLDLFSRSNRTLSSFTRVSNNFNQSAAQTTTINRFFSSFVPYSMIDYSIPPHVVYEKMSSQEFLTIAEDSTKVQQKFQDRLVIIAAGDYREVEYVHSSLPQATKYWCSLQPSLLRINPQTCDRVLTNGEIQAYAAYHYIIGKNLRQISFFWMALIGIILAKGIQLYLSNISLERRSSTIVTIQTALIVTNIVNSMIFFLFDLSIPLIIPSCTVISYLFSSKKNKHEK